MPARIVSYHLVLDAGVLLAVGIGDFGCNECHAILEDHENLVIRVDDINLILHTELSSSVTETLIDRRGFLTSELRISLLSGKPILLTVELLTEDKTILTLGAPLGVDRVDLILRKTSH
jgi:hypothetical protein